MKLSTRQKFDINIANDANKGNERHIPNEKEEVCRVFCLSNVE